MKKAFSFILVLILLVGMMVPAMAADPMKVTVTYPTGTAVGSTFTVTVSVSGNTGLNGAQMTLAYDKSVLDCTAANTGTVLGGMMGVSNPDATTGAIVAAIGTSTSTKNGTVCTFDFKVLKTGSYGFALEDFMLLDESGNAIPVTVTGMSASQPESNPPSGDTGSQPNQPTQPEQPGQSGGAGNESAAESTVFTDTVGHWAEAEINEAAATGLVGGYGGGIYGPNDKMTRAQFVTILWRYAGSPQPKGKSTFKDLEPHMTYYHKAVAWAEENGVINGMAPGVFDPTGNVTREQIATTLYRMQGSVPGGEIMFSGIYDEAFSDSANVSSWAKAAVYWAVYKDIWCAVDSTDVGDDLNSRHASNRAQIAVMMTRYQEKFPKGE